MAQRCGYVQSGGREFYGIWETQYDLLAKGLRESMDMEKICQIMEEGV